MSELIDTFPGRRYRLSCGGDSITVLAFSTTELSRMDDGLVQVKFIVGYDHVLTRRWMEERRPGEWITVESWMTPTMPPIPTDGLWHLLTVSFELARTGLGGVVGYCDPDAESTHHLGRAEPPRTAGVVRAVAA